MSSTVYPCGCVREWDIEYVRPCVQFFSSCTYSFFVGDSCTYLAYVGDRWWVSLISTSQHVHLHLHLRLHYIYIYIYIYLYYSTTSFKHETSHFLAWHDQPVPLLAPRLSQSASGRRFCRRLRSVCSHSVPHVINLKRILWPADHWKKYIFHPQM